MKIAWENWGDSRAKRRKSQPATSTGSRPRRRRRRAAGLSVSAFFNVSKPQHWQPFLCLFQDGAELGARLGRVPGLQCRIYNNQEEASLQGVRRVRVLKVFSQ